MTHYDEAIPDDVRNDVERLLGKWLAPTGAVHVTVLAGGAVNRNLRIRSDDADLVLRIAPPADIHPLLGVNMVNSGIAAKHAGEADLGPRVTGVELPDGHSLIAFLPGTILTPETVREPHHLDWIGALLARLHDTDPSRLEARPVFAETDTFLQNARDRGVLPRTFSRHLEAPYEACRSVMGDLEGMVVSHRDVNPQNLISCPDGLKLIDYDYAGLDTPYLDFTMISKYASLAEDHVDRLLRAGICDLRPVDSARVQLLGLVHSIREWGFCLVAPELLADRTDALTELLPGDDDASDFYSGYRDFNHAEALALAADVRFEEWLAVARSERATPPPGFR